MSDRLFTPRFFTMCAYSFTVFVSVFQLLPSAPYRILDLGGGTLAAGLFLGFLTYASALSAPLTGGIGDKLGQRRVLLTVSLVLAGFTSSYAIIRSIPLLLTVVFLHGLFWSALLSASGAYMTATLPESRRGEGIGYWGLTSALSVALAPPIGFWVYRHGWAALCVDITALNLIMASIAWFLPDDRHAHPALTHTTETGPARSVVEWRVLALSVTLGLISFGYGALTSFSALFADRLGVSPRSVFLTAMAAAVLAGRLSVGRTLDSLGHRRVLLPCLVAPALGLLTLSIARGPVTFVVAAVVFGGGFGLIYPSFTAYVMRHVSFSRRGAAFGAMLAAFDTGVGSGSSAVGWLIQRLGFRGAYSIAAGLAALALPYFLVMERRLGFRDLS
jgi:MFS family permease